MFSSSNIDRETLNRAAYSCKLGWSIIWRACTVDYHPCCVYHATTSGWSGSCGPALQGRGKSALYRARRRITSGAGKPAGLGPQKQTAASSLLKGEGEMVMVKRWCKRPPAFAVMRMARQPPPGARSSRGEIVFGRWETARLRSAPGRLHEWRGNVSPR